MSIFSRGGSCEDLAAAAAAEEEIARSSTSTQVKYFFLKKKYYDSSRNASMFLSQVLELGLLDEVDLCEEGGEGGGLDGPPSAQRPFLPRQFSTFDDDGI